MSVAGSNANVRRKSISADISGNWFGARTSVFFFLLGESGYREDFLWVVVVVEGMKERGFGKQNWK